MADLADLALADQVALEADDVFGGLDGLVANAAIPCRVPVTHLDDLDWVLGPSLLGVVRTMRAAAHLMLRGSRIARPVEP